MLYKYLVCGQTKILPVVYLDKQKSSWWCIWTNKNPPGGDHQEDFFLSRVIQGESYVPVLQIEAIVRLVLEISKNDTNTI